jgi:hypothetical protein
MSVTGSIYTADPSIPDLNKCLNDIINGQQNETIPPGVAAAAARRQAKKLSDTIVSIITNKQRVSERIQQQRVAAESAAMASAQRESELEENVKMMNEINNALANSNGRLNRAQRQRLHQLIMKSISNTITNKEIQEELALNGSQAQQNIRDLFNALITYYTEMASYGYERAPDILANIGSIVAGTAIIGSAILAPQVGAGDGILMTLSRYIGPITATASGLYFLQRGGLPVQPMLRSLGANTIQCVRVGCVALQQKMGDIYNAGLKSITTFVNPDYSKFTIDWDARSGNFSVAPSRAPSIAPSAAASVAPSTASTTSTAGAASVAIDEILDVDDDDREQEVINGITAPPNSIVSSPMFPAQGPFAQGPFPPAPPNSPGSASAAPPIPGEIWTKKTAAAAFDEREEEGQEASQGTNVSDITNEGFGSQRSDIGSQRSDFGSQLSDFDPEYGEHRDKRQRLPSVSEGQEENVNDVMRVDGGKRARKSRRNTKPRKSRKGRKGRKGRMTKKGRKHHKTLKRYRSKMRR